MKLKGTMEKIEDNCGTYKITKCNPKETNIATRRYGLIQGGEVSKLPSSLSAFSALNISMATNTVSESELAFALPSEKYSHLFFPLYENVGPFIAVE